MRVFVTGATGVVGRRLVPLLVGAGHEVTAVGRTDAARQAIREAGASAVALDVFSPSAARSAFAGHQAVVNLATHLPHSAFGMLFRRGWRDNDRIRTVASAILTDAAIAAGVERFVQESFAPVYPDSGDRWIDEGVPLRPIAVNRSILDAESSAAGFAESGRAAVVLRFAAFYGPDAFHVPVFIDSVKKGRTPVPGRPEAYVSSVSHDDAATAVVAALDVPPGTYNVTDDEPLPRSEAFAALAREVGARAPDPLPQWIAVMMGSLGELLGRSLRISNRRLREASAWRPRYPSLHEGWPAALREMLAAPGHGAKVPDGRS
jgi:nucleoside-diphosphate-sugar epimerase